MNPASGAEGAGPAAADRALRASWDAAVSVLGGHPDEVAARELVARYGEPHRRYHTAEHAAAVVAAAGWLAGEQRLAVADRAVLTLAAAAHDVVYRAQPGLDEQASADWAGEQLRRTGMPSSTVDRVRALVLDTAEHRPASGDPVAPALLDADLAILASAPPDYDRYVAQVRSEYAAVSEPDWRAGRARVLRSLIDRDPLYLTEPARAGFDRAARANMARELAALDRPGGR